MTLKDLEFQIETILPTTLKNPKLGGIQVFADPFILLLAPQGSCPQSILYMKFVYGALPSLCHQETNA